MAYNILPSEPKTSVTLDSLFASNSSAAPLDNVFTDSWFENFSLAMSPNSSEMDDYEPYPIRPEGYIVPAIFALIFIVGVLGNGTLVLIILRHRNMRNIRNTYIVNLALGDLLVLIMCVPFLSTLYTLESWPFGEVICKVSTSAKDISIGVSVFTLTALTAECYRDIVNPLRRHAHVSTKPMTVLCAVCIWALAFVLALPSAIFSYVHQFTIGNKTLEVCLQFPIEFEPFYSQIEVMFKFLVYYAIPLCIIAFFYVLMAINLKLSTRNMPGEMQHQSTTQIPARKKVGKVVLTCVIIFIVCFLPYHAYMLWFYFNPNALDDYDDYWHTMNIIGVTLSFINSCVNPIALYCVSGAFRKHFNNYLFYCCVEPTTARRRGTLVQFNLT